MLDLAVLDRHVEQRDLGHAQIAQRFRCPLDRSRDRFFPGLGACPYLLDHLVDAFRHVSLLASRVMRNLCREVPPSFSDSENTKSRAVARTHLDTQRLGLYLTDRLNTTDP